MRKAFAILVLAILAVAAVAYVFRKPLLVATIRRQAGATLRGDVLERLRSTDALHVVLCGTGSPLPDPSRSGPCTAIVTPERLVVIDAGSGTVRSLQLIGLSPARIDAVLLTHFHSDHIDGLGELLLQRWAGSSAAAALAIHGPPGVEEVVAGLARTYAADRGYRIAHHGEAVVPPSGAGGSARTFAAPAAGEEVPVLDEAGLRITAFRVDHAPVEPAVGYRIERGGRSVVVSGDTEKSENLARFAKGADVLVHEALAPHLVAILGEEAAHAGQTDLAKITRDILDYHTSPVEAAEIAREAGVGLLVFTHIVPPLPFAPLEELFAEGVADTWSGRWIVGRDRMVFTLPAGGERVDEGTL